MTRLLLPALAVARARAHRSGDARRCTVRHALGRPRRPARLPAARRTSRSSTTYSRTPSFTWQPGQRCTGGHYQFQIATSQSFQDATLVFKDMNVAQPAETVPRQLPWMTGEPYALWARVRWISNERPSGDAVEQAVRVQHPVGRQTRFRSSFPRPRGSSAGRRSTARPPTRCCIPTSMPAAVVPDHDERRRRARVLHLPQRARIRRRSTGASARSATSGSSRARRNGLPAVSYGPWSPVFTTVNTPQTTGDAASRPTPSRTSGTRQARPARASAHARVRLDAVRARDLGGHRPGIEPLPRLHLHRQELRQPHLHRARSSAHPPGRHERIGGPMPLPGDTDDARPGPDGAAVPHRVRLRGHPPSTPPARPVVSNETAGSQVGSQRRAPPPDRRRSAPPRPARPRSRASISGIPAGPAGASTGRSSRSPSSTRSWPQVSTPSSSSSSSASSSSSIVVELRLERRRRRPTTTWPCRRTPVSPALGMSFGKVSQPVVTAVRDAVPLGRRARPAGPSAVGRPDARRSSPRRSPRGSRSIGATKYQIEMSRSLYPWHAVEARRDAGHVDRAAADQVRRRHLVLPRPRRQREPAGRRAARWPGRRRSQVQVTGNRIAIVQVASRRAMGPDLRFAHELADAADAITLARFRALDLRVETKPDLTPVSEADRAAEEAIRALVAERRRRRGRARRGARRRRRRRPLDRRPDRRHAELRPRHPGLGDADRARARRRRRRRRRLGAGARPPLVGGARRGRLRGERRAHPRLGGGAASRTPSSRRRPRREMPAGWARARRARLGQPRASATSGSTAWSPRARSTSRPTSSSSSGTTPRCS